MEDISWALLGAIDTLFQADIDIVLFEGDRHEGVKPPGIQRCLYGMLSGGLRWRRSERLAIASSSPLNGNWNEASREEQLMSEWDREQLLAKARAAEGVASLRPNPPRRNGSVA